MLGPCLCSPAQERLGHTEVRPGNVHEEASGGGAALPFLHLFGKDSAIKVYNLQKKSTSVARSK